MRTMCAYQDMFGELDARIAALGGSPTARPPPPVLPPPPPPPSPVIGLKYAAMPYSAKMEETKCVICLEDFKETENVHMLECHHIFHPDCIAKWEVTKTECPICKHK